MRPCLEASRRKPVMNTLESLESGARRGQDAEDDGPVTPRCEYTGSPEVIQCWAWLVLGWLATREHQVLVSDNLVLQYHFQYHGNSELSLVSRPRATRGEAVIGKALL